MLFLIISANIAEDVVPLVYKHYCVEGIFLYGLSHDQSSFDCVRRYEKVHGHWTDVVELHKHLIRAIETVSQRQLRWRRCEKTIWDIAYSATA